MVPFVWAHRGASSRAPENTLAAFEMAINSGADGIECDVHLSRDGVPVIIHDESLERTTNGTGRVAERSLAQLRKLDAGSWFSPEWRGERIPTLEELFSLVGPGLFINVEIKSSQAARSVLELISGWPDVRVLLSSFDHRLLEGIRRIDSEVALAFLNESRLWRRAVERAVGCRAKSFHPRIDTLSTPMLRACHAAGMRVYPWTVDRPAVMRSLLRRGVDGWFTNEPATLF